MAEIGFKRRYIQVISALIYNANFKGFAEGEIYQGNIKGACVPGLNCYSCPGALGSCPLGSFQNAITVANKKIPFYIVGTLLLFGVLFGRVICGFVCPFGLIQELLYKIPSPKVKKNRVTKALSKLKYVILVLFVAVLSFIYKFPAFCKLICPAGTLEGGIPLVATNESIAAMTGLLFSWKVAVLIIIIIGAIFIYRDFCRFICPLGAIYAFFNKISVFGVHVEESKCIHCDKCIRECKMDISCVGDKECIQCGECKKVCPTGAIISKTRGKVTNNEKENYNSNMCVHDVSFERLHKQ